MTLKERIEGDVKESMKNAEKKHELEVLRMMKSALMNAEIDKRAKAGLDAKLDESEEMMIVQKAIKSLEESAGLYKQGGREDLYEDAQKELAIMRRYVPAQMTEHEIEVIAKEAVTEATNAGNANFGGVMKIITAKTKGRADGAVVSIIVKKLMSQ